MIQKVIATAEQIHLILIGSINAEEAESIRKNLVEDSGAGPREVIIDFSGVDYIDAAGLSAIVTINILLKRKGRCLYINGLHGDIKKIFEMAHLEKELNIQ
jgi:anti-anti-sigma factor